METGTIRSGSGTHPPGPSCPEAVVTPRSHAARWEADRRHVDNRARRPASGDTGEGAGHLGAGVVAVRPLHPPLVDVAALRATHQWGPGAEAPRFRGALMLGVPCFGTTTPGTTCRGDTDACVLPPGKVSTGAAADATVPRTLSVTAHRWSTRSTLVFQLSSAISSCACATYGLRQRDRPHGGSPGLEPTPRDYESHGNSPTSQLQTAEVSRPASSVHSDNAVRRDFAPRPAPRRAGATPF